MGKNVKVDEIVIKGVTYVPKGSSLAKEVDGLKFAVCRFKSAGVHVGFVKERNGDEVKLLNARRIWYWDGAASLSQIAMEGVTKPENCKFTMPVNEITILGLLECIPCTEKAKQNIEEVPIWKK
jgi:hypothetical protein